MSHMMTGEDLKNSILQMAMQGKLVEQRAEEGTGEELFQQLLIEQKKQIRNGKVKDKYLLGKITEEEIPFEIPGSWTWARIEECGYFISGYTPKTTELSRNGKIPYFKVSDMNTTGNEKFLRVTENFLSDAVKNPRTYAENTIVYPKNGGAVFTNKKRVLVCESVVDLNTGGYKPSSLLYFDYVFLLFSSIDFRQCFKGTALPTIDMEKLRHKLFPLPPLAEQKRIVAKIEELMPFVEKYSKSAQSLTTLNTSFPSDLKKSILQLAVEGKLVPQDPNDEPASVLLEKIKAEKEKLVKEGKIKKQKPLPPITEDEIPFDIPESWEWIRLSDVSKSIVDGDHMPPPQVPVGIPFLVISNLSSGVIDFSNMRHVPKEYYNSLSPERKADKGDVLFTVTGSFGIPVKVETEEEFCFQRHMALIKPMIDNDFLIAVLQSPLVQEQCDDVATGTAQRTVGIASLRNIIIPLPPQEEQERIAARIEKLLPVIESIKMPA